MIGNKSAHWFRFIFALCLLIALAVVKTGSATASCISTTSPANNSVVLPNSQVTIGFSDLCSGRWFECWYMDTARQGCSTPSPEQLTWNAPASGTHSILIKSYNKGGGTLLGSASESLIVGMPQTLVVSNPANGGVVTTFPQTVVDTDSSTKCGGAAWYDEVWIDGVHVGDANFSSYVIDSLLPGTHSIQVFAHTQNSGGYDCDSSPVQPFSVPTPSPSATPTPSPTPTPASYFPTLSATASLPTDAQCAAQIPTTTETYPGNTAFNQTIPTAAQLAAYVANGYTFDYRDDYSQYQRVDGNYTGSTDMILRWAACKYGVDENVVRAQAWIESGWTQGGHGDRRTTQSECVQGSFTSLWNTTITESDGSTVSCPSCCYQSWSLLQTKVYYEWMTWPEVMQSTAFAADYREADQRACMDGAYTSYMKNRGVTYAADVAAYQSNPTGLSANQTLTNPDGSQMTNQDRMLWGCVGLHYFGNWYDSGARTYIGEVESTYNSKPW
jgi:hypothetical protein